MNDESPPPLGATGARGTPQSSALEIDLVEAPGVASMRAPFRADLVGDPADGGLANGVITTLLDQTCGMAVSQWFLKRAEAENRALRMGGMATLDFRIDFLRPARAGLAVISQAKCEHVHGDVAFTRGVAFEESADDPVALVQAAFMISSQAPAA